MLAGLSPDVSFPFQGVEAIESGFIGGDLATGLDFADEGRLVVVGEILPDEVEHRLLFAR